MRDQERALIEPLTRFLDAVRGAETISSCGQLAAAELAGTTDADVAAVVRAGDVIGTAGAHGPDVTPEAILAATTAGPAADVAGLGRCDVAVSFADDPGRTRLVILRRQGAISKWEREYLTLAAGITAQALDLIASVDVERALLAQTARENDEHDRLVGSLLARQQQLDSLARIERSMSQRIPLGVVLSTITDAAYQLLGDDIVVLRLLDPDDSDYLLLISENGVKSDVFNSVRRTAVGAGAGGRAVVENLLVVVDDYAKDPAAIEAFVHIGVRAAMAAPVQVDKLAVGSLTVATFDPGRSFGPREQETLLAFAEHVSVALTEARNVEAAPNVLFSVVQTIARHSAQPPGDPRNQISLTTPGRGFELGLLIDRLLEGSQDFSSGAVQDASLPAIILAVVTPYAGSGRQLLVPPVQPQPLRVDVAKVQGALSTLVENAVRHSPAGSPIVVETDVEDDVVSVTVTAQGELPPGTAPESLFERQETTVPGPRLGLYLAGHLTAALGGSITVVCSDGTMSFTLRFPAGAKAASVSAGKSPFEPSVLASQRGKPTDRA